MAERFTIELPDQQAQSMREIARLADKPVETVIAEYFHFQIANGETIDTRLEETSSYSTIHLWMIVQRGLGFPSRLDKRMVELIQKGKEGIISETEQSELDALNDLYNKYVLLRARTLAELKHRGEDVRSFFEVSEY